MVELKEGRVTLEELANWFGCSYNTIRKTQNKASKLELLKKFADYHIEGRTIIIDKVKVSVYSKAYHVVKEKFSETWHENGIDTCARVGSEIYWKNETVKSQIKQETAQSYANIVKVEMYGHNNRGDYGTKGYSEYCWCRMNGYECEPLTPQQQEIMAQCSKETYGALLGEKAALLNDALNKGEIDAQEFNQGLALTEEERIDCYSKFETMVTEKLGFFPDRATRIVDCAWTDEMP